MEETSDLARLAMHQWEGDVEGMGRSYCGYKWQDDIKTSMISRRWRLALESHLTIDDDKSSRDRGV